MNARWLRKAQPGALFQVAVPVSCLGDPSHVPCGNHDIALISSAALSLPCIPIAMTAERPPFNPGSLSERRGAVSPCGEVPSLFQHRQRCHPASGNTPAPDTRTPGNVSVLSAGRREEQDHTAQGSSWNPDAKHSGGISGGALQAWVFDTRFDVCMQF